MADLNVSLIWRFHCKSGFCPTSLTCSTVLISFQVHTSRDLHTILLGPCKYLLKTAIPKLSKPQKDENKFSGFRVKWLSLSFVSRDFKAWAQMAPFITFPYLTNRDQVVWLKGKFVIFFGMCATAVQVFRILPIVNTLITPRNTNG